ncbi:MAG: restriction endonuclease [Brevinematales bacterium]|nr:restriction endonuclease [Brevinematales bacterium]
MEFLIALEIALVIAVIAYFVVSSLFKDQYKVITDLKSKGNYEEALKRLLRMYQKNKDDTRVIYELAEINKHLKNNLEAIGYYLKLVEKDTYPSITSKGEVLKDIGILFLNEKKIREAFYYLYYASYFLPADKDVNFSLFKVLFEEENFQLADTFGQRALPFYSKDPLFLTDYAITKLELGKYGDAIELAEKAAFSKNVKTRIVLGFTLHKLGGYRRAVDVVSSILTEEGIPDQVIYLAYKIITYSHIAMKNFNEAMKYWDQFLTFATSKGMDSVIREIGFGIFMTYLFFSRYESAKEMLSMLKEYNISDAVINSLSPFIDEAIRNTNLKKEMKPYDLRPIKEIENYVNSWINSSLRPREIVDAFVLRREKREKLNVIEIIKQVQEEMKIHNKKVEEFLSSGRGGLSVEDEEDICDMFTNRLDSNTFTSISEELVKALGFSILRKLDTDVFAEAEGIDFICSRHKEVDKYYVAVRRWGTNEIGKIAIVDINQKATENDCDRVFIISSAPLTEEARDYVEKNSRIEFKTCKEVAGVLKTIIPSV